eukprot:m.30053 g.30053  ORF g.30053 m.30053 type:complete len:75 (-) comp9345_c0_seq1:22-246(-)
MQRFAHHTQLHTQSLHSSTLKPCMLLESSVGTTHNKQQSTFKNNAYAHGRNKLPARKAAPPPCTCRRLFLPSVH